MGGRVHRQMQLAPDPTLLAAMFAHFPLAFAKDFQTSGVDDQVRYPAFGWLPVGHLERARTLADAGVTRSTLRHLHQRKQRVEQTLGRPQGKAENPFKHQEGTDGLVSVAQATPSPAVVLRVEPVVYGL